jgi:hypothetical protein
LICELLVEYGSLSCELLLHLLDIEFGVRIHRSTTLLDSGKVVVEKFQIQARCL